MSVIRIDRRLSQTAFPPLVKADIPAFQTGDVLLVGGGFEDRALAVLKAAARTGVKGVRVVDFEYRPGIEQNHFPEIAAMCAELGWEHISLIYDRCNPAGIFDSVAELLPKEGRLYIDVSGMSRLLIIQLVTGLVEHVPTTAVSIIYAEAKEYPPEQAEAEQVLAKKAVDSETLLSFISSGVYGVAAVPELSSSNLHRAPIRLIAFPSFNPAQLLSIRSSIQPAQITFIHGVPPDPALEWRQNIICKLNEISDEQNEESVAVSTLDYSEMLHILLGIYDRWSVFNSLVISPTGSKMQAVAVGIFRGFLSDVQIVYPTPLRFNNPEAHTHGVKRIFELRLDSFIELRRAELQRASG